MLHTKYSHARINNISSTSTYQPSEEQKKADLVTLMAEVPRVFDGVCRVMNGPPCHFFLKEGAVPVKIHGSRPVSEPLLAPFRDELAAQVKQGIIRKVRPEEVTPWIHGVVVVPKKQGGIRFCPDYRPLNKFLIGSKFDNPTPFKSVRSIPKGMQFFTVVDALKGYHQCALDTESMALTTFATPDGLHQYTRLPMGISHAGDDYGRRFFRHFWTHPQHCPLHGRPGDLFTHMRNTSTCYACFSKWPVTTTCRSTKTRRSSPNPQLFSPAMNYRQTDSGPTQSSHEPSENSRGQQTSPIYALFAVFANKWEISATRSP